MAKKFIKQNTWFYQDILGRKNLSSNNSEVIQSAKRFFSVKEWQAQCPRFFRLAQERGLLQECTEHMEKIHIVASPRRKYSDQMIIDSAKKCSTRGEFKKKYKGEYRAAIMRGIYKKACSHMPAKIPIRYPKEKWSKEKILSSAQKFSMKMAWKNGDRGAYRAAIRLGIYDECTSHMRKPKQVYGLRYSDQDINDAVAKCHTVRELKSKFPWAVRAAKNRGIYRVLTNSLFQEHCLNRKWTPEKILESAKKYKTPGEWKRAHKGAYSAAIDLKLLQVATAHMIRIGGPRPFEDGKLFYTDNEVIEKARSFTHLKEWRTQCPRLYRLARKRGVLQECTKHMIKGETYQSSKIKYSRDDIIKIALNFQTRTSFKKNHPRVYYAAKKEGPEFFESLFGSIKNTQLFVQKYSDSQIMASAKSCVYKTEFREKFPGEWKAAHKRGIYRDAVSHMPKTIRRMGHMDATDQVKSGLNDESPIQGKKAA